MVVVDRNDRKRERSFPSAASSSEEDPELQAAPGSCTEEQGPLAGRGQRVLALQRTISFAHGLVMVGKVLWLVQIGRVLLYPVLDVLERRMTVLNTKPPDHHLVRLYIQGLESPLWRKTKLQEEPQGMDHLLQEEP